ncbi:hypothetical protein BDW71DRAFT_198070 [Aspergillus fruticulosus]
MTDQKTRQYLILLGNRSLAKAEAAVEYLDKEVPKAPSIEAAFKVAEAKRGPMDALINNAGAHLGWEFNVCRITRRELLNKTFDVNQRDYAPSPPPQPDWPKDLVHYGIAYYSSKAALNMVMLNVSRMLTNDKLKVWCFSPGVIGGLKDAHVGKIAHFNGLLQDW